ncbi:MAG: AAA family ATPase, partial [Rhodospirillaceae bacterium]
MIVGISIFNFKSIENIEYLPLNEFHVLVGANGAGKSTFLDAIDFVRDCLIHGPQTAVESRGITNFADLTWNRQGGSIGIILWLDIGDNISSNDESIIDYSFKIRHDDDLGICVEGEFLSRRPGFVIQSELPNSFTRSLTNKPLLFKKNEGIGYYFSESDNRQNAFNFGPSKLALSQTPPDIIRYPTANAVKNFLMHGIRYIQLNSRAMRLPCIATRSTKFDLDGTNMARVVGKLIGKNTSLPSELPQWATPGSPIDNWTEHLRYALPDLRAIGWARRLADNAEYLVLKYEDGLEVPSWLLSDGTLRMLALTLLAFMPPTPAIYLVEEPENGVHPKALEIILRSLSSIPQGQVLMAT